MDQAELLRQLAAALEQLGLRYLITGSVATIYWGEPRLTVDVDVVVELTLEALPRLLAEFRHPDFYVSSEAAEQAVRGRRQFNVIHPASGLKIDVMVAAMDDFDRSRFSRARRVDLGGFQANLAAPEDAILMKLVYYRLGGSEKHLRDIAGVLAISGEGVDRDYIAAWAERLEVTPLWELVLAALSKRGGA